MPKRIIVMDDHQEILDLYVELLSEEGYEVVTQLTALYDLDLIRSLKPDLLILDYIMDGDIVGWRLLEMLKMSSALANLPVIICTAATQKVKEMESHLTAKGVSIVLKPFDIYDLIEAIKTALGSVGKGSDTATTSDSDRQ